ncbi:uncharacterized protein LOC122063979 [Macadamia integrifolia]|uniref:uncharacterized protein LOC122063979 n=1 Tax=Macadamia integrifolia TaxID=60698 RepID=UPI001C4FFB24|nr:uncharacterized protein LOC122063979 [Macadamia integrifolia]
MSVSPKHSRSSSNNNKEERPRFFDTKTKNLCWAKSDVVPGRHPDRWRKDAAGNIVCKRFCNCHGCLCFEYDHIIPYSKGGESTIENCQILQSRVNRFKADKDWVEKAELQGFSCDLKFTDKELDIIEMAVYGDVIRPGNQCRCRTVAEMLGQFKSKDRMAACKLPHDDTL